MAWFLALSPQSIISQCIIHAIILRGKEQGIKEKEKLVKTDLTAVYFLTNALVWEYCGLIGAHNWDNEVI